MLEPAKAPRKESVSSESESEEEAEYHPNVSVSVSHTQIPEEKEEELEQEVKKEEKMSEPVTDASAAAAEVGQPVEATEEAESAERKTEEEKEEEKEVAGSADVPEEAPNTEALSAGGAPTTAPAPVEEEEQPKMNGEASLAETELRPQVICCSEVKSGASALPPALAAPVYLSLLLLSVWVSPSRLREHLSPMCDLTPVCLRNSPRAKPVPTPPTGPIAPASLPLFMSHCSFSIHPSLSFCHLSSSHSPQHARCVSGVLLCVVKSVGPKVHGGVVDFLHAASHLRSVFGTDASPCARLIGPSRSPWQQHGGNHHCQA